MLFDGIINDYNIYAKSEGESILTIQNSKTGLPYKVVKVIVNAPEKVVRSVCAGTKTDLDIAYVTSEGGQPFKVDGSIDWATCLVGIKDTGINSDSPISSIGSTVIHKQTITVQIDKEGEHGIYFYDYDDNLIAAFVIQAKPHKYEKTGTTDATCYKKATEIFTCSNCGDSYETEIGDFADHIYGDWVVTKEASCKEKGSREKVCGACGNKVIEEIDLMPHAWNKEYSIDKKPTCTEEGSESYHCTVCGAMDESSSRSIEKIPHTYGDWIVTKEASCKEKGSKEKVCGVCGDKIVEEIDLLPHEWSEEYTTDKEATCTEEGSESYHCTVCDIKKEGSSRKIDKVPHSYGEWRIIKEVSCTENGIREKACSWCGKIITEEIESSGHQWEEEYTVDQPATCIVNGIRSIHCKNCKEVKNREEIKAVGHKPEVVEGTKATCTKNGLTDGEKCSVCGFVLTPQKIIPAIGHKEVILKGKPATATSTGLTNGKICSICSVVIEPQKLIPILHAKAADGTATGTGASATTAETAIKTAASDEGPSGTKFNLLQAQMKKVKKNSIKIGWKRISGAKYIVYGNKCGKGKKFEKIADVSGTSFTQKGLQKGTYYKYLVMAVRDGKVVSTSKTLHIATAGGKVGNNTKVTLSKKKITLKAGKSKKLRAKAKKGKLKVKKHRAIKWESSDPSVAIVSNSGKVKAIRKGEAIIYAYAQNGKFAKCKVTVK